MAGKQRSPQPILDLNWSYTITRTLMTAVELRIFTHIEQGAQTIAQLARATRASRRGVRMLADALVGLDLLKRAGGEYQLTADSAQFLVLGKPGYIGDIIEHTDILWSSWERLSDAVRSGKPVRAAENHPGFYAGLVRALFNSSYQKGKLAATRLRRQGVRFETILDVGAGSAGWSIPFAQLDRGTQVTALDFPEVLPVTREYVARMGLEAQFHYLPGNLRTVSFGKEQYDLIVLGNICHSEGAARTRRLLRKSHRALRPGGHVLIIEMLPDDRRTGPVFPLLFALNMLVNTGEGDTFTEAEYRAWLKQAGFGKTVKLDVASHSPLILSRKNSR